MAVNIKTMKDVLHLSENYCEDSMQLCGLTDRLIERSRERDVDHYCHCGLMILQRGSLQDSDMKHF